MPDYDDALKARYGFGLFPVPAYREASRGEWRVRNHLPGVGDGYLTGSAIERRAVLTRGREVWMSSGLLERESHAWHVHCARGTVVAAGVGMGMYVFAAAMKPEVERVVAADISADVIEVMKEASGFARWPCRGKVALVVADALAPDFAGTVAAHARGAAVDYLYADMWPDFPAVEAPAQTARMAKALSPRAGGWWGQELAFARWCANRACEPGIAALHDYFRAVNVPPPVFTNGYAAFCRDLMRAYGMDATPPLWRRAARWVAARSRGRSSGQG